MMTQLKKKGQPQRHTFAATNMNACHQLRPAVIIDDAMVNVLRLNESATQNETWGQLRRQ